MKRIKRNLRIGVIEIPEGVTGSRFKRFLHKNGIQWPYPTNRNKTSNLEVRELHQRLKEATPHRNLIPL